MKKAFTLLEVLLVLGLLVILIGGSLGFSNSSLVSANFITTVNDIRQAIFFVNNRALESYKNSDNGLHFESDSYTIFYGATYDELNDSNEIYELSPTISLTSVNFNSGQDLIFTKSTGLPVHSGSLEIVSNKGDSAIISIDVNGLTSVMYNQ